MKLISRIFKDFLGMPPVINLKDYRSFIICKLGFIFAALLHASWVFLFWALDIKVLMYVNVLSVIMFISLFFLNQKGHQLLLSTIAICEVVIHQTLCVYILGWDSGFQYYIILALLLPFLMQNGRNIIKFILVSMCIAIFMLLDLYFRNRAVIHPLPELTGRILHSTNLFLTLVNAPLWTFYFSDAVTKAENLLEIEREKSETLLLNILPPWIANKLKKESGIIAENYKSATVLFADVVGFTRIAQETEPHELVKILNELFSQFDDLVEKYRLEKIKTIGDAYMVSAGYPESRSDHAQAMGDFGLEMLGAIANFNRSHGQDFNLRIGISSGPVTAGVIGKKKFMYDVWGDAVNVASRMESHGTPGKIHISDLTFRIIENDFHAECRGIMDVKGKGPMTTYFLTGRKSPPLE